MSDSPDSLLIDNVKSLASGGVGGLAAVLTGHPFDLVKVRLQTNQYNSAVQCVKSTIALDGLRGLYRGVLPPIIGVTPIFAVSFWGYDMGRKLVVQVTQNTGELTIGQISTAGFISAIPTTLITLPFERVKVMMQVQKSGTNTSMFQVVRQIYAEGGLKSLFKGSLATLARDGPGSALYFATYEYVKKLLSTNDSDSLSLGAITIAGGSAGVAMWTGVFPVDTIKSVQQSSSTSISISQAMSKIYTKNGFKGFFPGIGPALARSFPLNAATFLGVELTKDLLNKL